MKHDRIKVDANESFRVNGTEVHVTGFDGKWLFIAWEDDDIDLTGGAPEGALRHVWGDDE